MRGFEFKAFHGSNIAVPSAFASNMGGEGGGGGGKGKLLAPVTQASTEQLPPPAFHAVRHFTEVTMIIFEHIQVSEKSDKER